ncbi:MAG: VanZ family protein, partial [Calditrichaeota bacterium]
QAAHRFSWRFYLLVFLLGSLYGVSDEFHQSFVPGRYTELSDFLADSAGVLFGLLCFVKWPKYVRNPSTAPDQERRDSALPAETKDRR